MTKKNIKILKGLDSDIASKIQDALQFICKFNSFDITIELIEDLSKSINEEDYLLIYLDELFLDDIVNNKISKKFFLGNQFSNAQVLIVLDDLDYAQLPEYLQYFTQFQITKTQTENIDIEFDNKNKDAKSNEYIEIVFDVIRYIRGEFESKDNKKKTIFLGPPDGNTTIESHKVIRELLQRKYIIKPDIINPSAKALIEDKQRLFDILDQSNLAIHFISHESLEKYPETLSPSYNINKLVSEYCNANKNKVLNRIIYVPAENDETSDEAVRKIAQFKSDMNSLSNGELVQTPIEKLKSIILSKIEELENYREDALQESTSEDLYLIYPPGKDKDLISIFNILDEKNISYSKSQPKLSHLELIHYHQSKLSTCKGVVIFNFGNNEWFKRKLSDIKKSPGWGRKKPFQLKAVCSNASISNGVDFELDKSFLKIDNITQENVKQFIIE